MTAVNLSCLAGAGAQFFDNNGVPLAGGLLYTYSAGTTTPTATYTTNAGSIANSNPIVLDASGRVTNEIWLITGSTYKFVLQTATATQIWSMDNIPGSNDYTSIYTALASTSSTSQGAGLVGFKQANSSGYLSGAVARTVQSKLKESVSIADFIPVSVDPTTTDVSTYIQEAINTGLDVLVPNGTFVCSQSLNLNNPYQSIYGLGWNSILTFTFSTPTVAIYMGDTSGSGNQQIRNLALLGISNCSKMVSIFGPETYIDFCTIRNTSSSGHCIYLEDENSGSNIYCFGAHITNSWIRGNLNSGSYGIYLGYNSQTAVIFNNRIEFNGTHIYFANTCDQASICSCTLENSVDTAIQFGAGSGTPYIWNISIRDSYFEQNQVCIKLLGGWFNNISVRNCFAYRNTSSITGSSFFWASGSNTLASSRNIDIEYNYIEAFSTVFQLDNEYGSNLASTKGNLLNGTTSWSVGSWADKAYKIRQFNPFFNKVTLSGTYASQNVLRIEGVDAVFQMPIQFETHEKAYQLTFLFAQNGSNQATVSLYKQTSNNSTQTSLGSVTATSSGVFVINIDGYQAEPDYNYYVQVTFNGASTSGYLWPLQLYLYE